MWKRTALATVAAIAASLLSSVTTASARSEMKEVQEPLIVRPSAAVEEVPGGWRGPIGIDFTDARSASYVVEVACGNGYLVQFEHTVSDDGNAFSEVVPPMPAKQGCGVTVWASENPDRFVARRDIITTGARFEIQDITATESFYPRRRDGFLDELRLEYWLTQPAAVTVDVINAQGRTVTTLARRHRFSGGNALVWDGSSTSGSVPPPGRYTARILATNLDGRSVTGRVSFFLADPVRITPGKIEKVRVGMTIEQAMRTGQLNRNVRYTVPGVCTRVYPLQPKAPHVFTYSVFVARGRVVEMSAATRHEVSLPRGLKDGSTVAQVRRAYRGRVSTGELDYGRNALFVRTGTRWIAFGFTSYSYERPLRPADRLTGVAVSTGPKPAGRAYDGC